MKIAFYVNSLANSPHTVNIFNQLNNAVSHRHIEDVSLFYNDVGFNSVVPKFGVFNSTELWYYTGTLIATSTKNVIQASKIVNKFSLLYLFSEDRDFVGLIRIPKNVQILVTNEADREYVARTTGRQPIMVPEDLNVDELIKAIQ